jgi:small subunit ribosomal protein S18
VGLALSAQAGRTGAAPAGGGAVFAGRSGFVALSVSQCGFARRFRLRVRAPLGARLASRGVPAPVFKTSSELPDNVAKQRRAKPTASRRRDKKAGGGGRRKPCPYCKDKIEQVDYKDVVGLRRFVSERGKIRSRRITGACRRHQSQIATAVKRARELALLPYAAEPTREEGPRGRSRDDRDRDRDRDR